MSQTRQAYTVVRGKDGMRAHVFLGEWKVGVFRGRRKLGTWWISPPSTELRGADAAERFIAKAGFKAAKEAERSR